MIEATFQSVFHMKMYQNNIYFKFFLKIYFWYDHHIKIIQKHQKINLIKLWLYHCSKWALNRKQFTRTNEGKISFFNSNWRFLPTDHKYRKNIKDYFCWQSWKRCCTPTSFWWKIAWCGVRVWWHCVWFPIR